MKDQKHLCRPAAYAANTHQFGNDDFVVHRTPGVYLDGTAVKVQRQVHQVLHLARAQTRRPHIVHFDFEHVGGRHFARKQREPVPHRLRCLDRNLLAHNAARQGDKGVPARLQAGVAKLRNQAPHDPVFFDQVLARVLPVVRGKNHRRYIISS